MFFSPSARIFCPFSLVHALFFADYACKQNKSQLIFVFFGLKSRFFKSQFPEILHNESLKALFFNKKLALILFASIVFVYTNTACWETQTPFSPI
jgi:hypothetical protein